MEFFFLKVSTYHIPKESNKNIKFTKITKFNLKLFKKKNRLKKLNITIFQELKSSLNL